MSITLAAFVKNEENCIAEMIKSVRPIVNEVIIVDTGSTDRTIEIVTPLANKVIHKEFTDFGDIRTFTLQQATCDWILMLDADEAILNTDLHKLLLMTKQTQFDAWTLPRHQWDNIQNLPNGPQVAGVEKKVYPDWQNRLFKNGPDIKYINKVHETLVGYKHIGKLPLNISPHIQHYGFYYKDKDRLFKAYQLYDTLLKNNDH